ncbi:MAG: IS630 family transposase [Candidatus Hydrogenedentes bacterium]|nr:IS630 family transposase [Candidatus Hydrogenedentota bacterium]
MRKIREVLQLKWEDGLSNLAIGKKYGIGSTTVGKYVARASQVGLSWPLPDKFDNGALDEILFPARSCEFGRPLPDWEEVYCRVTCEGVTLQSLWAEYRKAHPQDGYEYTQFCNLFKSWRNDHELPDVLPGKWQISNVPAQDIPILEKWRRSNDRTKWAQAVLVLESSRGACIARLCEKVEKSPSLANKWLKTYQREGIDGLMHRVTKRLSAEKQMEMSIRRDRIVELLHESPRIHGINRASWSLGTLARAYEAAHAESIGISTISDYVRSEGYSFKKARRVLTSPDPQYREKLKEITSILSTLGTNEKFFSVDEFGPFTVRMCGGKALTAKGDTRVIPQHQKGKGRLIITAALELSTNQITHFYSTKKNTDEMIRLLEILLKQYSKENRIYLSWDAASWHVSGRLKQKVAEINNEEYRTSYKTPFVMLAPLPASAQFLNVIESVFSGMARAILHNSDYQSVEECKSTIDKYFEERNRAFRENPKRAGNKIWGKEPVTAQFASTNNCKDRNWR